MIKKLVLGALGVIVAIVVIFCVVVAMQPSHFTITRSATFNAPPEALFTEVNDFNKWQAWSPWEKIDPNMKKTISTPSSGKGANYAWAGNDEAGEGKMTITDSRPNEAIKASTSQLASANLQHLRDDHVRIRQLHLLDRR